MSDDPSRGRLGAAFNVCRRRTTRANRAPSKTARKAPNPAEKLAARTAILSMAPPDSCHPIPTRAGRVRAAVPAYASFASEVHCTMLRFPVILPIALALAAPAALGAGRTATGSGAMQSDAAIDLKVVVPQLLQMRL